MKVSYYPSNRNAYARGDIHVHAKNVGADICFEIHRNAGGGDGSEILVKYDPNACDKKVLEIITKLIPKNRGFKDGTWLANANLMGTTGISYGLLEIGFIDNNGDNKEYDNAIKEMGYQLYDAIKSYGYKHLLIVYGHGEGDPGAVANGRREDNEVRRLKIEQRPVNKPSITIEPIGNTQLYFNKDTYLYNYDTGQKAIDKVYQKGNGVIVAGKSSNGYYVTSYSMSNGIHNGFKIADLSPKDIDGNNSHCDEERAKIKQLEANNASLRKQLESYVSVDKIYIKKD